MAVPVEQWAIQAFQDESTDLSADIHFNHRGKHVDVMGCLYVLDAVTLERRFTLTLKYNNDILNVQGYNLLSHRCYTCQFKTLNPQPVSICCSEWYVLFAQEGMKKVKWNLDSREVRRETADVRHNYRGIAKILALT